MTSLAYAEIGITTNFSFLRGGSHPQDYVHQAGKLGLAAIGIADHNTLAGIVRAYSELDNLSSPTSQSFSTAHVLSSHAERRTSWSIRVTARLMGGCVNCSPKASAATKLTRSRRASAG